MKKLIILALTMVGLLCGCNKEIEKPKGCEFLINHEWEADSIGDSQVISFREDGSFSNWCHCGSPVGDGDLVEKYYYREEEKEIVLLGENGSGHELEVIQIIYTDDFYLVVDAWDEVVTYENENAPVIDTENEEVLDELFMNYDGRDEVSKPCVTILGYENNEITITQYNYDADAKDNYELWTVKCVEEIVFDTYSLTEINGVEEVEYSKLAESDYEFIGEHYTNGYLTFNDEGQVVRVSFYGKTAVWE